MNGGIASINLYDVKPGTNDSSSNPVPRPYWE